MQLDSLQKEDLRFFISQVSKELLRAAREERNISDSMIHAADVFSKAKDYLDANVSVVHITGMLTAELAASEGEKS